MRACEFCGLTFNDFLVWLMHMRMTHGHRCTPHDQHNPEKHGT